MADIMIEGGFVDQTRGGGENGFGRTVIFGENDSDGFGETFLELPNILLTRPLETENRLVGITNDKKIGIFAPK